MTGIYSITNTANSKTYIGSSSNISQRWVNHKCLLNKGTHDNQYLQRAWEKYGADAFTFEVIEECQTEVLIEREQYWHDYYKQSGTYNIGAFVDNPFRGVKHSEESKAKMSEAHTGKKLSEEAKLKMSEVRTGKQHSNQTKQRMSKAASKEWRFISPEGINTTINNLSQFCKENGLIFAGMHMVNKGLRKSHKGWTRGRVNS